MNDRKEAVPAPDIATPDEAAVSAELDATAAAGSGDGSPDDNVVRETGTRFIHTFFSALKTFVNPGWSIMPWKCSPWCTL